MLVFYSILPILIVLVMLFIFKQTAIRSGIVGVLVTIILTFSIHSFAMEYFQLSIQVIKASLLTIIVTYVLFFGLLLFHLLNATGLLKGMASVISRLTPDPLRQIMILALGFSPLLESVSGFGLAMIVIAPVLIELGVPKFKAVLISVISLSAVPWGTLALGTIIGANLGGISTQSLGVGSALLSIPTFIYFAFLIIFIANGKLGIKEKFWEVLFLSTLMGVIVYLSNLFISVELAGILGSLSVILALLLIILLKDSESASLKRIKCKELNVFSPYIFLIIVLLVSRVVTPISVFLQDHIVWSIPTYQFTLPIIYSPGFYLFITCVFVIFFLGISYPVVQQSIKRTITQVTPVTVSTLLFVSISEIMSAATMTEIIATSAAILFGSAFIVVSPFIGGLGGFLTGSNTSSNAMFINLQIQTANHLGLPADLIASAHNTSSAHLIMASPTRVLLGANIGGIKELENSLMSRISLVGLGTIGIVIIQVMIYYYISS